VPKDESPQSHAEPISDELERTRRDDDEPTTDPEQHLEPQLPAHVGPYRIVKLLGSGGMGMVYLAEQSEPVTRQVAVKVMRDALRGQESMLRFLAERQALALLQHPNIAQMFEAGTTEDGHPYFAMELVDGISIVRYCDQHQLGLEQRLELLCSVCHGVQHAHQKGVLHRDLKPANILICEVEGQPVAKIIDFGIAKALGDPFVDGTLLTGERLIGTPAYLSPEAAAQDPDIDTRSDVYSLGVLLYELLVGVRPFERGNERFIQMLRSIIEEDPTGPSTRWSTLDKTSKEMIAHERGLETTSLRRRLRGDLDWIVLKAIAKDRSQRYGTPADLAADIKRHLTHRPVEAGPPSMLYRLTKFSRRHRTAVGALVMLVALAGKYTYDLRAEQQRTLTALQQAEQARQEAQQVSDFLVGVFEVSNPSEQRGNQVTAREILDKGAERIDRELADQPLVRGRLLITISRVFQNLGLYAESVDLMKKAVATYRDPTCDDERNLAIALYNLGMGYYMLDDYDKATQLHQESLAIRQRLLPPDHPEIAASLEELAQIDFDQGKLDEALELCQRSVDIRRKHDAEDDPSLPSSLLLLGEILAAKGEFELACSTFEEGVKVAEHALGPSSMTLARVLESYGSLALNLNRMDQATALLNRSYEMRELLLSEEHPDLGISASYLGYVFLLQGQLAKAQTHLLRGQEILQRTLGPDHYNVGANLILLGELYLGMGRYDEAASAYEQALALWEAKGLGNGSNGLSAREGLADLAHARGDLSRAEQLYRSCLASWEEQQGEVSLNAISSLFNLAAVALEGHRYHQAEELLATAAHRMNALAADAPAQERLTLQASQAALEGRLLAARGQTHAAHQRWQAALDTLASVETADTDIYLRSLKARLLLRLGDTAHARPLVAELTDLGWVDPELEQLARDEAQ